MPNYRRLWVPGGTYFFTVNLADRSSSLLVERIDALRESVREAMRVRPFVAVAWVVLPDHMHALWTLPEGDADFATRWMRIKQAFCDRVPRHERIAMNRRSRGERGIWQRRYWEHAIRDERDLRNPYRLHPLQSGETRAGDAAPWTGRSLPFIGSSATGCCHRTGPGRRADRDPMATGKPGRTFRTAR
jgi:Transposase and inactivated derivatives